MPKRIKDKNKSVLVKFHEDVADKEISSMLALLGISGTKVSSIVNRWAVEVPFWKEGHFVAKFNGDERVEKVHESFDRKKTSSIREEADSDEENI
jgi:hypothetical protein